MTYRFAAMIGLIALTSSFGPVLLAQDQNGTSAKPNQEHSLTDNAVGEITRSDLMDLEPSIRDRILRLWQYQFQYLEQPAFIVATVNSTTEVIPNPDKWLDQHSIILDFSELFPRVTNRAALIQAAYETRTKFRNDKTVRLGKDLCGERFALDCLTAKGNFFARLFSGAKVNFGVSQRDEVQQQILVPNLPASQGWQWSYEIDYDPSNLYITSSDWSKAEKAIMQMKNLDPDRNFNTDETGCMGPNMSSSLADCENQFARPRFGVSNPQNWLSRVVESLVPTVQFKALSQFDFIKQGGILLAEPNLQRTLKNLTLTWDLRHIVPSVTDRLAVASMLSPSSNSGNVPAGSAQDGSKGSKICVMIAGNSRSYLSVAQSAVMTFCRAVAVDIGADHYALACASERNVLIGTSSATSEYPEKKNIPDTDCGWTEKETPAQL